jgi:hypothetical protein
MLDAFRVIWKRNGLKGFARGLSPRVLTFMPSNALCWFIIRVFSVRAPPFPQNDVDAIFLRRGCDYGTNNCLLALPELLLRFSKLGTGATYLIHPYFGACGLSHLAVNHFEYIVVEVCRVIYCS